MRREKGADVERDLREDRGGERDEGVREEKSERVMPSALRSSLNLR